MEALTRHFAQQANVSRQLLRAAGAYLAQPDMRELLADALALGWNLLAYECESNRYPKQGPRAYRSLGFANWRDSEEARNIAEFLAASAAGTKLLVWCGNSHQRKTPQRYHTGGTWIRLGQRLREQTGIDPFVIDQSVTVEYHRGRSPRRADVERFRVELEELGGTAGFLREEDPDPRWRKNMSADAFVLSIENTME